MHSYISGSAQPRESLWLCITEAGLHLRHVASCPRAPPQEPLPCPVSVVFVPNLAPQCQANDTYGATTAEITEASYDSEGYRQIMGVIARRLQDIGEAWRHVYKSLLLLEYMLKHGPQKVRFGCFTGFS